MSSSQKSVIGPESSAVEARIDEFGGSDLMSMTAIPSDSISEETATRITEPVLFVKELYETNSAAIHAAAAAIATCGGPGRALDDWLGVADKVVAGLDGLAKSSAFPFVGGQFVGAPL